MSIRTIAFAALCSAVLSACVVAPAQPYPYGYGAPAGPVVVADVAPPAPYYEPVPVVPYPGAVWITGYWGWSGGRAASSGWCGEWCRPRRSYRRASGRRRC